MSSPGCGWPRRTHRSPVASRSRGVVNAHTAVYAPALVVWGTYLFFGVDRVAGYLGLLLWWVTTAIGLLILMRLMPAKRKRASEGGQDERTRSRVSMSVTSAHSWVPLRGVGRADSRGALFVPRLHSGLGLPIKSFNCWVPVTAP